MTDGGRQLASRYRGDAEGTVGTRRDRIRVGPLSVPGHSRLSIVEFRRMVAYGEAVKKYGTSCLLIRIMRLNPCLMTLEKLSLGG